MGEANAPPFLTPSWKPEPKRPDWLIPYENRNRLSISEAVCLLVRTDPEIAEPYGINDNEGYAEMRRWKAALFDAINSNKWKFGESTWGMNRDEEQTIEHSGIRAWARDTSAPWPFLTDELAPPPNSVEGIAVANELKAAKNRIAELEKKLIEATVAIKQPNEIGPAQTPLMKIATEIYRQFWSTFDKDAPGAKAPTQAEIIAWATKKYSMAGAAAKAAEKVACPIDRDPSKK